MAIFWILVFIVSLAALIKGADWLLKSAEKIGLALGMSSFAVGVIIVGIGTSFPELFSSFVAVLKNTTEIVAANAIGSNIANILLIVGAAAVVGRRLVVTKNLIDLELPLLAIGTVIFLALAWDKQINFWESAILVAAYLIYLLYTLFHRDDDIREEKSDETKSARPKIVLRDIALLFVGIAGLVLGANYLVESVIKLSLIFNVAVGVISITAVALGTSLPELLVSIKAALRGKSEVALGNIFGSNAFNIMMVIGLPGLVKTLTIDAPTFAIGIPAMALATLLFIISGISRRIHLWEGAFYLIFYLVFIGKLFNLF